MALSTYPRNIPTFPTHRDLLDDVEAAHINNIQREVSAIAASVGANPALYYDVAVPQIQVPAGTPGDEGGIDPDLDQSGSPRRYDPAIKIEDYGTVSARLDFLQKGQNNHCVALRASNIDISSSTVGLGANATPKTVRFPSPSANNDPFELYGGAGVHLRKSGFYVFHGHVIYNMLGSTGASNAGRYLVSVARNGDWVDSASIIEVGATQDAQTRTATLAGFFNRGDVIKLRVAQNSGRQQKIRLARLTGFLVRETVGD